MCDADLETICNSLPQGLKPHANPIQEFPNDVPMIMGLKKTDRGYLGLHLSDFEQAINKYSDNKNNPYSQVFSYLKSLNHKFHVPIWYDCEDRALWTMAHVRNRFPGLPIGIISGVAPGGALSGQRHAFNILWWRKKDKILYSLWDPVLDDFYEIEDFQNKIGEMRAIIAFPPSVDRNERMNPITERYPSLFPLSSKEKGHIIPFDERRLIYPFSGEKGLGKYLQDNDTGDATSYNSAPCHEKHDSVDGRGSDVYKDWFRDYDRALWSFVHVRRAYPGCPVGLAIGKRRKRPGGMLWASYENIIWFRKGDAKNGEITYKYWKPGENSGEGKFSEIDMDSLKTIII
jgi:hypothetical protein